MGFIKTEAFATLAMSHVENVPAHPWISALSAITTRFLTMVAFVWANALKVNLQIPIQECV